MLLQVVKNNIARVCRKRVFSFVRCVELKRRQQRQGVKVVFLSPRHQLVVWFLPGSILTPSRRALYLLLSWFLFRKNCFVIVVIMLVFVLLTHVLHQRCD